MMPGDIPDGVRLKTAAGWNQTAEDWRRFLDVSPDGCFAAEYNGSVVGTVTTISYGSEVSWIGMMLVDPAYRRRGIARRLMQRGLEWLGECETIKLDATPAGKKVYDTLGFRDEYGLSRMITGSVRIPTALSRGISSITRDDFSEIAVLDGVVFGADRMAILESLTRDNPGTALKYTCNGVIRGYCMGRPGTNFYQIGPIVAETAADAVNVTGAALQHLAGRPVVIDVPAAQQRFMQWLVHSGFTVERTFIRMYYGANNHPGCPEKVFAICGPELG